jgi:3-deoxy-D-arabino-heptulosonate 7-phosphate (DAHP) synthase
MATMMFMGVMVESNITEGKQKCTPGVASENQSDLRQQWSSKK